MVLKEYRYSLFQLKGTADLVAFDLGLLLNLDRLPI